jgi:hypothetical protein
MSYLATPTPSNNTKIVSRKNWVINGGFDIWQRGTSFTTAPTSPTGIGQYTVDNWKSYTVATGTLSRQTFTLGQTDVPGNPQYYMNWTQSATAGNSNIRNPIENVVLSSGKTFTVSCWIRNNAATSSTVKIQFLQAFGTGGSPSTEIDAIGATTFSIPGDATWYKIQATITLPSLSGKVLGTDGNDYFAPYLGINTLSGSNIDIAQFQMEEGSSATDFEPVNIAIDTMLCRRYYEEIVVGTISKNVSTGNYNGAPPIDIFFKVTKRSAPTSFLISFYTNSTKTTSGLLLNGTTTTTTLYTMDTAYTNKFSVFGASLTTVGDYLEGYATADATL